MPIVFGSKDSAIISKKLAALLVKEGYAETDDEDELDEGDVILYTDNGIEAEAWGYIEQYIKDHYGDIESDD